MEESDMTLATNSFSLAIPALKEFKDLKSDDVLKILNQHYNTNFSVTQMSNILAADAKRNFTTRTEIVCRVIRKHYGLPVIQGVKLYPADQINDEINKRIQDMVRKRTKDPIGNKRSEKIIRKKIIKVAIRASRFLSSKNGFELEIQKRCKLTGMTREEVERSLYCAYFQIGIE
jgi:hypothetical protein